MSYDLKIQHQCKSSGIMKNRSTKEIRNKIFKHEDKFEEIYEFANGKTGTGIRERDYLESFNKLVTKRFKCHFDLEPYYDCVTRPILTIDEVDDDEHNDTKRVKHWYPVFN